MKPILLRACVAAALALTAVPALAQSDGVTEITPATSGQQIYAYVCQGCHMADARGGTGAATIPALAGNPRLKNAGYPISMVLHGRGAMPSLTDTLTPAEIAKVVTYVRTHFGNNYTDPVTEADVTKLASGR